MSSKTIFLASKSPRRRDLLTRLGYDVRVIASNAHTLMAFEGDEVVLPDEAPKAYVLRTARTKFLEGLGVKNAGEFAGVRLPIVAADTVVSLGNEILGKPRDFDEACLFLEKLSGRTHDVRTAVYVGLSETACDWRISQLPRAHARRNRGLRQQRRALRQGGRLRHPGPCEHLHLEHFGQLHRHHGTPRLRDGRAPRQCGPSRLQRSISRPVANSHEKSPLTRAFFMTAEAASIRS